MRTQYGLLEVIDVISRGPARYAHLRQSVSCELPEGIADHEVGLLGFYNSLATRELYYKIPLRTTKDDFELLLSSYPDAKIIRILDHEVILTPRQRERVHNEVLNLTEIADTQLIKNPDGSVYIDAFGLAVFAQNRLCLSGMLDDHDYRWLSPATGAELDDEITEPTLVSEYEKQRS